MIKINKNTKDASIFYVEENKRQRPYIHCMYVCIYVHVRNIHCRRILYKLKNEDKVQPDSSLPTTLNTVESGVATALTTTPFKQL